MPPAQVEAPVPREADRVVGTYCICNFGTCCCCCFPPLFSGKRDIWLMRSVRVIMLFTHSISSPPSPHLSSKQTSKSAFFYSFCDPGNREGELQIRIDFAYKRLEDFFSFFSFSFFGVKREGGNLLFVSLAFSVCGKRSKCIFGYTV